jgi:hypothetical protein
MSLPRTENDVKENLPPPPLPETDRVADIRFLIQVAAELRHTLSHREKTSSQILALPAFAALTMYSATLIILLIDPPSYWEYSLPDTNFNSPFETMNLHALCIRTRRFYDKDSNIGKFDLQRMLADFQAIDYREATEDDMQKEKSALVQLRKFQVGLNRRNVNCLRFFKDRYVVVEVIDQQEEQAALRIGG